ncbi:hypothetical protein PUNSTDRAFT_124714 [Punctularia strigosozonata HHB-11173 SS5]|uniref:uncharacterized protein n=1 Tax=Punctularia strigosozonata (strain HHB-11173) TaxID=741275 RepID=UPI0004417C49|nr:uncharacterized protein PUNSTDRAFT_124714 [Punctularia strigosozonata HHB-11173 SS5]EIN11281.1 hypothetical protein PUNSTDRAFT_124714 [Punctularia strigosozonata HHB-11173 SS5]
MASRRRTLLSLPAESLLAVAEILCNLGDAEYSQPQGPAALHALSMTCKRLNAITAHWIFADYVLRFRVAGVDAGADNASDRHLTAPQTPLWSATTFGSLGGPDRTLKRLTPLDKDVTFENWDDAAIAARLAHLRTKSAYVRTLTIRDSRLTLDGPAAFAVPQAVVDALMRMQFTRLSSIKFECDDSYGPASLSSGLWSFIVRQKTHLRQLTLKGFEDIPEDDATLSLDSISLGTFNSRTAGLLQRVGKPKAIELRCPLSEAPPPFKPDDPSIRSIVVDLHSEWDPDPEAWRFDFSKVPYASIEFNYSIPCEEQSYTREQWNQIRLRFPKLISGDLRSWGCRRTGPLDITVWRSALSSPQAQNRAIAQSGERRREEEAEKSTYDWWRLQAQGYM